MTTRILIIGGYGNFGGHIAQTLAPERTIQVIIGGRSEQKARHFMALMDAANEPEFIRIDIHKNLDATLDAAKPHLVIHTSGPFQGQDYHVARACIARKIAYIDLADARNFVANITTLDAEAKANETTIISGASSVPALTAAIIDRYHPEFKTLESVDYAISTAQKTNRGLATTAAILSYCGKKFTTLIEGEMRPVYGWQDLHFRHFPQLGKRALGNCDIPDLVLFPARYPDLKTIRFYAGLEVMAEHIGLWALSGLVRARLLPRLSFLARPLLKVSRLFDRFGSESSGFYMHLAGIGHDGSPKAITFDLTARDGYGIYIPTIPAILLARRFAAGEITRFGAFPCLDMISLSEYQAAMREYNIVWDVEETL